MSRPTTGRVMSSSQVRSQEEASTRSWIQRM